MNIVFRRFEEKDRNDFFSMVKKFYAPPAVLHFPTCSGRQPESAGPLSAGLSCSRNASGKSGISVEKSAENASVET